MGNNVPFEHFNSTPPEERATESVETPPVAETPPAETPPTGETPPTTVPPTEEPPKVEEPPKDEFFDNFNKRYNTQYKSDEELKAIFDLPKKVEDYETRLKDRDELEKSVEQYKKDLEDYKTNGLSSLLEKPLIRKAYVAEQLQAKYPGKDVTTMQEVAMSDIDNMGDIEAIAKERMISVKGITFDEAKLAKLADFGIDPEVNPEEWDSTAKARVKIAGAEARERMKQLVDGIELPKTISKEERALLEAQALEQKIKTVTPVRDRYNKFDEYTHGDFKFAVPDEFKKKTDEIFDNFFIKGGMDVNESTLATAELLKRAMFVEDYLEKMLEVKFKEGETAAKEKYDKLLNNDAPLNTTTATDQTTTEDPNRPSVSRFFQSREDLAKKL